MTKHLEQKTFGFFKPVPRPNNSSFSIPPKKAPFLPPLLQGVDAKPLKSTFMITLRTILNSANRTPESDKSQEIFATALRAEIRIKRGVADPIVATRTAILKTIFLNTKNSS